MSLTNARGQYGPPRLGAEASASSGRSIAPWLLGGVGLAVVSLALLGARAARRPQLTAHEEEVRAWEAEFPGLPWYMDQVKDAGQLDLWERARDYWEKTH
jgi:hypothetical protein